MQAMPPLYNNKKPNVPYTTNGYPSHSTQLPIQYNSLTNAPHLEFYTPTNIFTQVPQLNESIPSYNSMVPLNTTNYHNVSINPNFPPFKTPKVRRRAFSKRSKTGCFTCRERRIKCDECKPICKNCIKSKRICKFPNPDEVKQKSTKFKHNTILKKSKQEEIDETDIVKLPPFHDNNSTLKSEKLNDVLLSSTTKIQDPINWKDNTFKTIPKETDLKDQTAINSQFPKSSFKNLSAEPTPFSQSTDILYNSNQQPRQRSERSQSLHIQQQQPQQQPQPQQQQDHYAYTNTNQYHPLYTHSYNLPPTQLPHDYSFPPQIQNSTLHTLGYQTYKDSTSNTNYGIVNVVPTQGNHLNIKSNSDNWGNNRYTHSNIESFTTGDDKEYYYVPFGKHNQLDNLNQNQQLPTYQQLQNNQFNQLQQNTPNSNNSIFRNKNLNEFNQLLNKEQ